MRTKLIVGIALAAIAAVSTPAFCQEPAADPAAVPVEETAPVQEPAAEEFVPDPDREAVEAVTQVVEPPAPATSVDTGVALQEAIAAHTTLATSGDTAAADVAELEAALAAARARASTASTDVGASAATVHAAYDAHIEALEREHVAEVAALRAEQEAYAAP